MSLLRIKNLMLVAAMGVFAVGCSSTPTSDDSEVVMSGGSYLNSTGGPSKDVKVSTESIPADGKLAGTAITAEDEAAKLLASLKGQRVHFDFDRSDIKSEFAEIIKGHARYLELNPQARLTIEGHCDERGTREYNLALGERRANAVKNALISEGVNPSRLNVISFGKDMPLVELSNNEAWSKNRRAEFVY